MLKRYLLAPGPTQVPPEVLLAMARPILHHRAPEFAALFAQVREDLKWLFQTRNDVRNGGRRWILKLSPTP